MKETREIINAVRSAPAGDSFALATVVDVKGSSYRLPGAKMLVRADGSFVGTVSGGCVEADVLERASRVLESGEPEVFLYDTTVNDSSVFSLNMGCKGIVRVLLERAAAGSEYLAFLENVLDSGMAGYAATIVGKGGSAASICQRSYFDSDGELKGGSAPDEVIRRVAELASVKKGGRRPAEIVSFEETGAEYFIEKVEPPRHLLILGAGADAIPLADIGSRIGWRVTVADHRAAYANEERFSGADRIVVCRPEDISVHVVPESGTAIVIMSHNFSHDREYLRQALASEAGYVGALGPRVRTEDLLAELSGDGVEFSHGQLERLFAPVGLDTGGADPESIAVSIVSEIDAVFSGREGGHLRGRGGPIYDR
jgi:xanthine dehydrogenase accessory factor